MNLLQNKNTKVVAMSSYIHFTLEERICLQKLLSEGKSFRQIAAILGRSPSTISREVNRNKAKYPPKQKSNNAFNYNHWRAQIQTICRRRQNRRTALVQGSFKYDYVVEKLNLFWSPEQIAMRMRTDYPGQIVGTATIYRYIKRGDLPGIKKQTHLRRKGKNRNLVHHNSNVIHPDRIIPEWTDEIKKRSRTGDWEGDTVYGGIGKGFIVTLVDRKTRYLRAGLLNKRNAKETREIIEELLTGCTVKSISFDNGTEFADFRILEENINAPVYFAEPHKPWQRGTNENTNDILRFFFPKGYDFRKLSQAQLDVVVDLINNRPRKCLGWKSPAEIFVALA